MPRYNLSIEEENKLYNKINCIKIICIVLFLAVVFLLILSINLLIDRKITSDVSKSDIAEYIDLEEIAYNRGHYIYRDINTDVLYLQIKYNSGELVMTPILNPDGTAKLYEGN